MPHRLKNGHTRHTTHSAVKAIKPNKFRHALELLNEAAREKQQDLHESLGTQYADLKEVFNDAAKNGKEKVKQAASRVDQKVHERPWLILSSVALGCLVIGNLRARALQPPESQFSRENGTKK